MKTIIVWLIVLALLGGGAWAGWRWMHRPVPPPTYTTATVSRGELVITIGATGTVEPEEVVDVGAQVAGQLKAFGNDVNGKPVDYGSQIEAGSLLAQLDDELYQAELAQVNAQKQLAQAQVLGAQANLSLGQAKLEQAKCDWERAQKLGPSEALAASAFDGYKAAFSVAKAGVEANQAAITQAEAQVAVNDASIVRAKRNLGYCTIRSPVSGTIIDRRVNLGQTVVASLNAPSLFLIAKDLKRMQVWVAVNEADIGTIKPGTPVTFTVDAFPGKTFQGAVKQARLNATVTQNVVTYTVVVAADNSDGTLLPYLTANVSFEVNRRRDVLRVPNAALRWTPQPQYIQQPPAVPAPAAPADSATAATPPGTDAAVKPDTAATPAPDAAAAAADPANPRRGNREGGGNGGSGGGWRKKKSADSAAGTIWVTVANGMVKAVPVRVGPTDGRLTEIEGKDVAENLTVVTAEATPAPSATGGRPGATTGAVASDGTVSPFTPKMPRPPR